jgi:hypothetical protein
VAFDVIGPWTKGARDAATDSVAPGTGPGAITLILLLLGTAVVLAFRNLKSGRADRRGAFRLGVVVVSLTMAGWLVWPHISNLGIERSRMFVTLGLGLFLAGALYVIYLAIEPFVRRSWPTMLVGWSRLLSGQIQDPYVGRDLLIGVSAGLATVVIQSVPMIVPRWLAWPEPMPPAAQASALVDLRQFLAVVVSALSSGLQGGLLTVLQLALARYLIQRVMTRFKMTRVPIDVVTIVVVLLLVCGVTLLDASGDARQVWLSVAVEVATTLVTVLLVMRVGLLATVFSYAVSLLVTRVPLTLDGSRFYAGQGWLMLASMLVLCALGMRWATTRSARHRTPAH